VIISSNSFCAPGHFIKNPEGGIEVADTNEPLEQDVAGDAVGRDVELGGRGAEDGGSEAEAARGDEGVVEGVEGADGGVGDWELTSRREGEEEAEGWERRQRAEKGQGPVGEGGEAGRAQRCTGMVARWSTWKQWKLQKSPGLGLLLKQAVKFVSKFSRFFYQQ
jgi:hypothetical protein